MYSVEKQPRLNKVGQDVRRWQRSLLVDPLLLVLAFLIVLERVYYDLPSEVSTWRTFNFWPYQIAQGWNLWFGMTFYYFVVLQWIWRFLIWSYCLAKMALLWPDLQGLHPDRVGGLGFLLRYQKMFGFVIFAVSAVASSNLALLVLHGNQSVDSFLKPVVLYLFIVDLILMLPLFVFTPVLIVTRNQGLIRYSRFGTEYAAEFAQKWLKEGKEKAVLGTPDIQSLNDLHGSYRSHTQMRVSLADMRTMTVISTFVLIPLAPLLLFKFPIVELASMILKYFFKL